MSMINCITVGPNVDLNSPQYKANSDAAMIHGLQKAHKITN